MKQHGFTISLGTQTKMAHETLSLCLIDNMIPQPSGSRSNYRWPGGEANQWSWMVVGPQTVTGRESLPWCLVPRVGASLQKLPMPLKESCLNQWVLHLTRRSSLEEVNWCPEKSGHFGSQVPLCAAHGRWFSPLVRVVLIRERQCTIATDHTQDTPG